MNGQIFAEKEVLAIKDILVRQFLFCAADEDQFALLKAYLKIVLTQNEIEEMDPNYIGTFQELEAYVDGRPSEYSLNEHVEFHQQNLKRWLMEIEIYNTREAVTLDGPSK